MPCPWRRRPKLGRVEARLREPPDDQHETDDRYEGIDPLPRAFAEPRDRLRAQGFRTDADRVKPEKDHEAEHENRHARSALR